MKAFITVDNDKISIDGGTVIVPHGYMAVYADRQTPPGKRDPVWITNNTFIWKPKHWWDLRKWWRFFSLILRRSDRQHDQPEDDLSGCHPELQTKGNSGFPSGWTSGTDGWNLANVKELVDAYPKPKVRYDGTLRPRGTHLERIHALAYLLSLAFARDDLRDMASVCKVRHGKTKSITAMRLATEALAEQPKLRVRVSMEEV